MAIQNKITTKQHNSKQFKKTLNDRISSITKQELAGLKLENKTQNDANPDVKADETQRKKIAQTAEDRIQAKIKTVIAEFYRT